jgi:hypothetical protein
MFNMKTRPQRIIATFAPETQFEVNLMLRPARLRFFSARKKRAWCNVRIMSLRKCSWLLALLAPLFMNAQTNITVFKSGPKQTALLELYTSEGCSSCPPAEKWLSELRNSPRLWKDFVPVAFHVDYWDRLGWRDPWSDKEFSDRQLSYAESWHSENVCTPAFVLDGKEWPGWRASDDGPRSSGLNVGSLTASCSEPDKWKIEFEPANTNGAGYQIHATLLASGVVSDVKAGENRGRRLNHDFAVAGFVTVPMHHADGIWQGRFILPQPSNGPITNAAIAVWITDRENLQAVQAVGGWIGAPDRFRAAQK